MLDATSLPLLHLATVSWGPTRASVVHAGLYTRLLAQLFSPGDAPVGLGPVPTSIGVAAVIDLGDRHRLGVHFSPRGTFRIGNEPGTLSRAGK